MNTAIDNIRFRQGQADTNGACTAVLIVPDAGLAGLLAATQGLTAELRVVRRLSEYPSSEALAALVAEVSPQVVLLDLVTDLARACALIRELNSLDLDLHVIGLHSCRDGDALMQSIRSGATEFLHAPFDQAEIRGALARIGRLRRAGGKGGADGRLVAFTSAKPGSGSSTLAAQTALLLRAATGQRVLLADLVLEGGLFAVDSIPEARGSVMDALAGTGRLDIAAWPAITAYAGSIDVLPSPAVPGSREPDPERLHSLLTSARQAFDWVVVDLPNAFHPRSLVAMFEADMSFIVTTTELPSLHLARRAMERLRHLGVSKERCHLLVNRAMYCGYLDRQAVGEVLSSPVFATLPNDYASLHRMIRFGERVSAATEFGASLDRLITRLRESLSGRYRAAPVSGTLSLAAAH